MSNGRAKKKKRVWASGTWAVGKKDAERRNDGRYSMTGGARVATNLT
jgi:hypothetical protein